MSGSHRIIVPLLGMHRSGTSLATRAFCEAGLPMGPALMTEPTPDNADGYWEDADIVVVQNELTDWLLRQVGASFQFAGHAAADFAADWIASAPAVEACDKLCEIVSRRFEDAPVFGFKDPRTSRLIAIWRKVGERLDARLAPVLLTRAPGPVAASINARQGVPIAIGETLWLRAMSDILADAGEELGPRLAYESWHESDAVMERIRAFVTELGLEPVVRPAPFQVAFRHQPETAAVMPGLDAIAAMINGGEAPGRIVLEIAALVSAAGGWRRLPSAAASQHAMVYAHGGLPLVFPPTPGDLDPPDELTWCPGAGGVLHAGNEWCHNGWIGFRLHASASPPAAALVWRGLAAPASGRLVFEVMASDDAAVPLALQVSLQHGGGAPISDALVPLSPGAREVSLPFDLAPGEALDVRLALHLASDGPAHNAWALIRRPRIIG